MRWRCLTLSWWFGLCWWILFRVWLFFVSNLDHRTRCWSESERQWAPIDSKQPVVVWSDNLGVVDEQWTAMMQCCGSRLTIEDKLTSFLLDTLGVCHVWGFNRTKSVVNGYVIGVCLEMRYKLIENENWWRRTDVEKKMTKGWQDLWSRFRTPHQQSRQRTSRRRETDGQGAANRKNPPSHSSNGDIWAGEPIEFSVSNLAFQPSHQEVQQIGDCFDYFSLKRNWPCRCWIADSMFIRQIWGSGIWKRWKCLKCVQHQNLWCWSEWHY